MKVFSTVVFCGLWVVACTSESTGASGTSGASGSSGTGGTDSASSTDDASGTDGGNTTPGPEAPPKVKRFVFGDFGYVDEKDVFYARYASNGLWLDFDPGPVDRYLHNQLRGISCIVRGPKKRLTCYTQGTTATARTAAIVRSANLGFENVTTLTFHLTPSSAVDEHVICLTHGVGGMNCIYGGAVAGFKPVWLDSVEVGSVKRVLSATSNLGRVITKDGRIKRCSRQMVGSNAVECVTGPELLPDVTLETAIGTEAKGIGITTTGTVVQWGFAAEAAPPPAGTFRKLVSAVGADGYSPIGAFVCAIATTDELQCWSLDATNAAASLGSVVGGKVSDATVNSNSTALRTIGLDGVLKEWPAGTVVERPTYAPGLYSCSADAAGKSPPVCSEITDFQTSTPAEYDALCSKDGAVMKPGTCRARHPELNIQSACLGNGFKIGTKDVKGMAYFYVNGFADAQAEQSCRVTGGKFIEPKKY